MSLQQFCHRSVVKVAPQENIAETCRLMDEKDVGFIVVEDGGKLMGIITDRDIALKVSGTARNPVTTTVEEIMSRNPIRISVDKDLRSLSALLYACQVRRVPIVDSFDGVLGIVSFDDVIGLVGDQLSEIGQAIASELPDEMQDNEAKKR